ncbi:uncharacterized protein LOC132281320 [Cornus florida]|uniref:uncharacterized protein LOC132281320 n=1 Tax=Cornus florida TaxID=4283 RepID=UPI00289DB2BC|nr:uncharacterized protein LOC132281320 [Cornus florida]
METEKIQIFIWQCAHNRLPVLQSLKARRIASCSICPVCGIEEKSLIHLLFRCHVSLAAWRISPLRLDFSSIPCISWPQIWKILSSLWRLHPDGDSFKSFFTFLCWQLWLNRNNWHFNRKRGNPKSVVDCALFSFNEFWEAKSQDGCMTFPHFSSPPHPSHWLPPTLGRLKLNVDAAIPNHINGMGSGFILRNHLGITLRVATFFLEGSHSPEAAEARSIRHGIHLLAHWGFSDVDIETDCANLVNSSPSSELAAVIYEDIRSLISAS